MTVLVTGGAGYIGSHCVAALKRHGYDILVADNLSTGYRESLPREFRFYMGDITNRDFLRGLFSREQRIDAVMHFAAFSLAGESMSQPGRYLQNNAGGTIAILEAMREYGVNKIVFSSSAAVYGQPDQLPITEEAHKHPTSPYGESKLMSERALAWFTRAHGTRFVALRYFNACGAARDGTLGEAHNPESHLIPIVLQTAQGRRDKLSIYGRDYPTHDGTCIRDYIHVEDLVDAHVLALEHLLGGGESNVFNLGLGRGYSNLEVVNTAQEVTGRQIPVEFAPRRPGDPASLIASGDRARTMLGWTPQYTDLRDMIADAWRWHTTHPDGFR